MKAVDEMHIIDVDDVKTLLDMFPSNLIDKKGCRFDILQVDQKSEYHVLALLLTQAFMDDPIYVCMQPLNNLRYELLFNITYFLAQHTSFRGMNWLLVDSLNIIEAKAGLLASPAGLESGHYGPVLLYAPVMLKHVRFSDMLSLQPMEKFHYKLCGDLKNHIYVVFVSTTVSYKSAGLGTIIFTKLNEIADFADSFVYLENSKAKNLEFYQKQGLKVLGKLKMENSEAKTQGVAFGMRRPNRSKTGDEREFEDEFVTLKHVKGQ